MPHFHTAIVRHLIEEREGLQRVEVEPARGAANADTGIAGSDGWSDVRRAYVLTGLTGHVAVGDEVILNTTAVDRGLGTGGWHVVHWNLSRRDLVATGPDHVMKLRYTSLQFDAGTSELEHPDIPTSLDGVPVVATLVHSQVGVVAAVLRSLRPDARIAFVMTDGAALPLALSDLVAMLRARGLLDLCVTAGHAFGGDLEAVGVPSALTLARHVGHADFVIAGVGPGVVGTGTTLGTTAIDAAAVLDTAEALGGTPVLCVRASSGDRRARHRGVSHHARTVAALTHSRPWVATVPQEAGELAGVRVRSVTTPDVARILRDCGVDITTMGRGIGQDPLFFAAAAAAAALAHQLAM